MLLKFVRFANYVLKNYIYYQTAKTTEESNVKDLLRPEPYKYILHYGTVMFYDAAEN